MGGDGGTDICAEYDADGLPEGQQSRTDKTDRQNNGRRGALNHASYKHTEQEAHDRAVRHACETGFHCAAGRLFQAIAHDAHAVKEHGEPAEEGYYFIKYVHCFLLIIVISR